MFNQKKVLTAIVISSVVATVAFSAIVVTSDSSDNNIQQPYTISMDDLGITEKEFISTMDAFGYGGIYVHGTDDGTVLADGFNTVNDGRFGYDKISNTHYVIYLDSLSVSLIVNGGGAAVSGAIGLLIGGPVGAAIGGAIGVAISTLINEYGIDYSNGIAVDVYFKNAIIIFGHMIWPGNPTFVNLRPQ